MTPPPRLPRRPPGQNPAVEAVVFDEHACRRWLNQPCPTDTRLRRGDQLSVADTFGLGQQGVLATLDELVALPPPGWHPHRDLRRVALWRIPDGDALDQGAIVTVDLANGLRLATAHQDLTDLVPATLRGPPAACAALGRIAALVNQLVAGYRRH